MSSSTSATEPVDGEIDDLPDEAVMMIFANADLATLSVLSRVSRRFNALANDPALVIEKASLLSADQRRQIYESLGARGAAGAVLYTRLMGNARTAWSAAQFRLTDPAAILRAFNTLANSNERTFSRSMFATMDALHLLSEIARLHDMAALVSWIAVMREHFPGMVPFTDHAPEFADSNLDAALKVMVAADWAAAIHVVMAARRSDDMAFSLLRLDEAAEANRWDVFRALMRYSKTVFIDPTNPASSAAQWNWLIIRFHADPPPPTDVFDLMLATPSVPEHAKDVLRTILARRRQHEMVSRAALAVLPATPPPSAAAAAAFPAFSVPAPATTAGVPRFSVPRSSESINTEMNTRFRGLRL